jgi:putative inorganic carbon (hco3(-)) transporter
MRDILLITVFTVLLFRILRRPEVGPYTWAWVSIMNPHRLTYGFAFSVPFALIAAVFTLFSFIVSKHARRAFPFTLLTGVYLLLMGWMTVSSVASINPEDVVLERWIFVFKIHFMMCITMCMLRGRKQIETLLWVVMGSVVFYGIKGGMWTLLTGGGSRVWGPPGGMMEENNALAVGLICMLPFLYYFRGVTGKRWLRWGLTISMVLVGVAILGSQSRGALLGLLAMAVFLGAKGRKPIRFTFLLAIFLAAGISFMPAKWTKRMDTIQDYQADTSAMSRIYTWQTLWNVAVDRPLTGAGYGSDNLRLFDRYSPKDSDYNHFKGSVWVAHSIYFQALGEHGFVGLGLYLMLWILVWMTAAQNARRAEKIPELAVWAPLLMRMCQVSMIGFLVGGAFLSLMHLDLPYYIVAFVVLTKCAVDERAPLVTTSVVKKYALSDKPDPRLMAR